MRTYKDAKAMAKSLRDVLAVRNVSVSHSECLEIVAQQFGFPDWNTLSSKLSNEEKRTAVSKDNDAAPRPTGAARRVAAPSVERVPIMPLRDVVVYPGIVIPIFAGRQKTIRAAELAMSGDKRVMLVTQRQWDVNEPTADDLYPIGTLANVLEEWELRKTAESSAEDMSLVTNPPGVTRKILVKGISRAHVDIDRAEDHVSGYVTMLADIEAQSVGALDPLKKAVMTRFEQFARIKGWPPKTWSAPPGPPALETILGRFGSFDIGKFADTIAAHTPLRLEQKQQVLEMLDVGKRLEYVDAATRELEQAGWPDLHR
jgi:ATP-dependent Lon protease